MSGSDSEPEALKAGRYGESEDNDDQVTSPPTLPTRHMSRRNRSSNSTSSPPPPPRVLGSSTHSESTLAAAVPTTLTRRRGEMLTTAVPRTKGGRTTSSDQITTNGLDDDEDDDDLQPGAYAVAGRALGARRTTSNASSAADSVSSFHGSNRSLQPPSQRHPMGNTTRVTAVEEESSMSGSLSRVSNASIPPELRVRNSLLDSRTSREMSTPLESTVEEKPNASSGKRTWIYIGVGIALLIGVIVGVVVFLVGGDGGSESPPDIVDTPAPTPSTTLPPSFDEWRDRLAYLSSDPSVLDDPESPQYMALLWLASEDQVIDGLSNFESRYALAVLYFATKGDDWTKQLNFLTSSTECNWRSQDGQGVTCNSDGHVVSLILEQLSVKGEMPEEIKALSNLDELRITQSDGFRVDVATVRPFDNLRILDLSGNQIDGSLPFLLSRIPKLEELYLSDNAFHGSIPNSFDDLTNLKVLDLGNNNLGGEADRGIKGMMALEDLRLDGNPGLFVRVFRYHTLPNLKFLSLNGIHSEISFPPQLLSASNLEVLRWDSGNLGDELPLQQPHFLPRLKILSLKDNDLTGEIPWTSLPDGLQELDLAKNEFSGSISEAIGRLTNLQILDLSYNKLDGQIPSTLGNMTSLGRVVLNGNSFSGSIEFLCQNLTIDTVTDCDGALPCTCCGCP